MPRSTLAPAILATNTLRVAPGPANTKPVLSVSADNYFVMTKPFIAQLSLGAESRFRLVVPRKAGGQWYFDTNPRHEEGHQLPARGRAQFRIATISRTHFQQSRPAGPGFTKIVNTPVTLLHFRLGPEVEGHPGYYQLLRGL
jgi:hypothetical protein